MKDVKLGTLDCSADAGIVFRLGFPKGVHKLLNLYFCVCKMVEDNISK